MIPLKMKPNIHSENVKEDSDNMMKLT